jgi:hypothetical protein
MNLLLLDNQKVAGKIAQYVLKVMREQPIKKSKVVLTPYYQQVSFDIFGKPGQLRRPPAGSYFDMYI